jgi:hypothetical protein
MTTPNCIALTASRCRVGDMVAAVAVASNDTRDGFSYWADGTPLQGLPYNYFSSKSYGAYLDTSKPGTFSLSRGGMTIGSLTIDPALIGTVHRVTSVGNLETVLNGTDIKPGAVVWLAAGTYTFNKPLTAKVPITLRAEGYCLLQSGIADDNYPCINAAADITFDSCIIGRNLIAADSAARVTLIDCKIRSSVLNKAGMGHGNGPLPGVTAVRCRFESGGGIGVAGPALFSECVFASAQNYPHNLQINGGSGIVLHRCSFVGSARGVVVNGGTNIFLDDCDFDRVVGDSNGAENILIEGGASNVTITSSRFRNHGGPAISFFCNGNRPVSQKILIAGNRFYGSPDAIVLWSVDGSPIDDVAVFNNYHEGGRCFLQTLGKPGTVTNVKGGNNLMVDQRPVPDHNGVCNLNPYALNISDGVIQRNPASPNDPNDVWLYSATGGFKNEMVGQTWSNSPSDWHAVLAVLDEHRIRYGNYIAPGTTGIVIKLDSTQPIYCEPGYGNTVAITVVRPFTKGFAVGSAALTVR